MPQLDIMTFYIQGYSVCLSLVGCYLFFYFFFLPAISISLFSRFLLKKKYSVDKRVFKYKLRKVINRIVIINAPIYNSINQAIYLFNAYFFSSFRVKKITLYNNFYDHFSSDIICLLHQYSIK